MRGTTRMLETTTLTRRTLLGRGIACAVASVIPGHLFAEFALSTQDRANLYVFSGAHTGSTVFAITWPGVVSGNSLVKIHAGTKSWSVQLPANTDQVAWDQDDCRIFAGNLIEHAGAVIVEAPNQRLHGGGAIDVWAEQFTAAGSRLRTGSPFVAALVAEDQELARRYHTLLPEEDCVALREDIARAIAARARMHGSVDDPDAYGRRLAARFLPDVLHYNPKLPAGFTFAGQNGRHPGEASELVVDTILNGSPAVTSEQTLPRLQTRFPYFSRA